MAPPPTSVHEITYNTEYSSVDYDEEIEDDPGQAAAQSFAYLTLANLVLDGITADPPSGASVLDVGGGIGVGLAAVVAALDPAASRRHRGPDAPVLQASLDVSRPSNEALLHAFEELDLGPVVAHEGDFRDPSVRDAVQEACKQPLGFDVVICTRLMNHFRSDGFPAVIHSLLRYCKPGGGTLVFEYFPIDQSARWAHCAAEGGYPIAIWQVTEKDWSISSPTDAIRYVRESVSNGSKRPDGRLKTTFSRTDYTNATAELVNILKRVGDQPFTPSFSRKYICEAQEQDDNSSGPTNAPHEMRMVTNVSNDEAELRYFLDDPSLVGEYRYRVPTPLRVVQAIRRLWVEDALERNEGLVSSVPYSILCVIEREK